MVEETEKEGLERLMIAAGGTNVVFVADTLERRFPSVYGDMKTILEQHGIPLRIIPGTRDIWCRDYMPIQVSEARFVQFRYAPDYLRGKYRHLRADGEIGPTLPFIKDCVRSEIVLDGGNVVRSKNVAILTDKLYAENPRMGRRSLNDRVRAELGVDRLIVIPSEPGDVTGHADGVLQFVGEGKVVINDYRLAAPSYGRRLISVLKLAGLEVETVPYWTASERSEGMPSAVGNYINFLHVGAIAVVPSYLVSEDEVARGKLRSAFTDTEVIGLDCTGLARSGGVLSCITWPVNLPADLEGTAGTCT